jgi:hypothetical protein
MPTIIEVIATRATQPKASEHTVPFDHHPYNRQSSSFPDEAPTDIPASAGQLLPSLPGLASPFGNALASSAYLSNRSCG